jgi:hypothetical protein
MSLISDYFHVFLRKKVSRCNPSSREVTEIVGQCGNISLITFMYFQGRKYLVVTLVPERSMRKLGSVVTCH